MEQKLIFIKKILFTQEELDELNAAKNQYHDFQIPKKHGGFREIEAPSDILKQYQTKLITSLGESKIFSHIHASAHGFLPHRSTLTNARPHLGSRFLLNIDLKDFFPSISHQKVVNAFKVIYKLDDDEANKLAEVFTHNGHLPQGGPYSPILSNVVTYILDKKISSYCSRFNAKYTRYADDITISWDSTNVISAFYDKTNKKVSNSIAKIINSEGFTINDKKTFYSGINGHKEVTGIIINKILNAPKDYYYRLRSIINDGLKHGLEEAAKHYFEKKGVTYDKSKLPEFISVIKGMMSYYSMIRSSIEPDSNQRYINLAKKANLLLGKHYFEYNDKLDTLIEAAENGDVEAQYQLGIRHANNSFLWLKFAAINGHKEAHKALFDRANINQFSTLEEKIRWVQRSTDLSDFEKTKIIYSTVEKSNTEASEYLFKLAKESYERGDLEYCDKFAECYFLGVGTDPDPKKGHEILEEGAKRGNYLCKAMLIAHDFYIGDEANAFALSKQIEDEITKVNELTKQEKYLYFRNKGYVYYKEGFGKLVAAFKVAQKYLNVQFLRNLDNNSFDELEFSKVLKFLKRYVGSDFSGILSLELAKLYLEGKFINKDLIMAESFIYSVGNKQEYLPSRYKTLLMTYKDMIKKEKIAYHLKPSVDLSYLIKKTKLNKLFEQSNDNEPSNEDEMLPF